MIRVFILFFIHMCCIFTSFATEKRNFFSTSKIAMMIFSDLTNGTIKPEYLYSKGSCPHDNTILPSTALLLNSSSYVFLINKRYDKKILKIQNINIIELISEEDEGAFVDPANPHVWNDYQNLRIIVKNTFNYIKSNNIYEEEKLIANFNKLNAKLDELEKDLENTLFAQTNKKFLFLGENLFYFNRNIKSDSIISQKVSSIFDYQRLNSNLEKSNIVYCEPNMRKVCDKYKEVHSINFYDVEFETYDFNKSPYDFLTIAHFYKIHNQFK
jgi:ABC-type Zn uptake system ZnuABC Zn-binding protein ZnuA